MLPDSKLFELIKALRGPERGFIHVFAAKEEIGKTKTLVLFEVFCEAVDTLERYDEKWVEQQLEERDEHEIKRQLPTYKTRLYSYILKVMRVFTTKKNIGIILRECMEDIVFLMNHALYDQAASMLEKTKKEAERYEQHWALLELLEIERRLIYDTSGSDLEKMIARNTAEVQQVAERQSVEQELLVLYHLLFTQLRLCLTGRSIDESVIQKVLAHPLLDGDSRISTFVGLRYLYGIRAMLCRIAKNDAACFECELKLFLLWRHPGNRHFVEDNPQACMRFLSNFGGLCVRLLKQTYYDEVLGFFADIPLRSKDDEAEQFQDMVYLRLLWFINVDRSGLNRKFLDEFAAGMERFEGKINKARELTFYYLLLCWFFTGDDFSEAYNWAEKIVLRRKYGVREDVLHAVYLLFAICTCETDNGDLDNVCRRMERYIRGSRPLHPHEKYLLNFIRRVPDFLARRELKSEALKAREYIENVLRRPDGKSTLGVQEQWYWLESIITGMRISALRKASRKPGDTPS